MFSQTATMSQIRSSHTATRSVFFFKLLSLFLLVMAFASGLIQLFRTKPDYPLWLQNWFAVTTLAVVAGFGSRWVLNRRSGFIRFVVAMATYLSGLLLLGFLSEWKYGIGPLEFWPKQMDVEGLAQVGVGLVVFLLVFRAWKRRSPAVTQVVASPRSIPTPAPKVERTPARKPTPAPSKVSNRKPVLGFLRSAQKPAKKAQAGGIRSKKTVKPGRAATPVSQKKSRGWRGRPKVQLAIVEEHRCPFCLEPVSRVDPRGVVECDVCHTLHHKDCWEITGVCQVPHYNS
ncbi:MAG: hypothetical protein C4583_02700 [Anaerolineaceae bacterium]|nr:MAG: hypothetical protein C4583_02700 [Anaerolineaceae bacterium]